MKIVIGLVALVLATVVFHFASPWWFTPIASNWTAIDSTINVTFWVTGLVFIAVNLFMAYAIYRFRYNKNRKAQYEPENKKLEVWLTGLTGIGIAIMLAPGLFVWLDYVKVPDEAKQVEVVGKQWHWSYRFPGEDGQLGRTHPRFIDADNPFGIDPSDQAGQDDVLILGSELRLPINQSVELLLRSEDVLHSFGVPQFRAKMDLVPGMTSYFWFEPTKLGSYEILCMQLCGFAHHLMRGKVTVTEQADFQQWLDDHPTFAQTQEIEPDLQAGQASYAVCASCHGQQGEGNRALNAPKLTGLEPWYLERQLKYYKEGVRGAHEDDQYGQQMAGMMGTLRDDEAIRNVSEYIASLPDEPAEPTVEGDVEQGEFYYSNCASCHGDRAQGNWATHAPRLAGQHDWYLARQMNAFRDKVRGAHTDDHFGMQMVMMAQVIKTDEAVNDLVAYINTLAEE